MPMDGFGIKTRGEWCFFLFFGKAKKQLQRAEVLKLRYCIDTIQRTMLNFDLTVIVCACITEACMSFIFVP